MYNLIRRDLILQKKHLLFYIPIILLFVLTDKHPAFIFMVASIFIPFNTYAYDEKVQTNMLLNSLPYTRTEIIAARYLGAIVYMLLSIAFTSLLLFLFDRSFTLIHMAVGGGLFLLFAALTFPLFYVLKPGYITTGVMVGFLVLSFFGPSVYFYLAENLTFVNSFISSLSYLALFIGAIVAIAAIYSLSWLFTTIIYKQKAF